MKKTKKLLSIALAAVSVLSMSTAAFAAPDPPGEKEKVKEEIVVTELASVNFQFSPKFGDKIITNSVTVSAKDAEGKDVEIEELHFMKGNVEWGKVLPSAEGSDYTYTTGSGKTVYVKDITSSKDVYEDDTYDVWVELDDEAISVSDETVVTINGKAPLMLSKTSNKITAESTFEVKGPRYNVTYDLNGLEAKAPSNVKDVKPGTKVNLEKPTEIPKDVQFLGWALTKDANKEECKDVTIKDADVTVYAIYVTEYTITYDFGKLADKKDVKVKSNEVYTIPACTVKVEGKEFKEWNTKADGTGTAFKAGEKTIMTASGTLYAIFADPAQEPVTDPEKKEDAKTDEKTDEKADDKKAEEKKDEKAEDKKADVDSKIPETGSSFAGTLAAMALVMGGAAGAIVLSKKKREEM